MERKNNSYHYDEVFNIVEIWMEKYILTVCIGSVEACILFLKIKKGTNDPNRHVEGCAQEWTRERF